VIFLEAITAKPMTIKSTSNVFSKVFVIGILPRWKITSGAKDGIIYILKEKRFLVKKY